MAVRVSSLLSALGGALRHGRIQVIDLTKPLSSETPMVKLGPGLAGSRPFTLTETSRYDARGPSWYRNDFACGEHTGTHFDAPVHWITGRDLPCGSVDLVPTGRMLAPVVVINCAAQVAQDPDHLLEPGAIRDWEDLHGRIPAGAWVLMRSDWSKKLQVDSYLNIREDGPHTPGPSAAAVRFLLEERDILGFGSEVVGTDAGQAGRFDPPYPAHHLLLGADRYGLAGLCNLDLLPVTGTMLITAPLKIAGGSGSPLRVLALAERPLGDPGQ